MELWGNGNPSGFDPEDEGSTPSGSAHFSERGVNMPPFFVEDMTDAQKAEYFSFLEKTKGGQTMKCEHKRIKSENCVISCVDCGEILPLEFLTGNKSSAPGTPAETPENGVKTATKKQTRKKVKA